MATGPNSPGRGTKAGGDSWNAAGRGVSRGTPVGYSSSPGESVVIAVGLIVTMLLVIGFMTVSIFLFADLRTAQGANKKMDRRVQELKRQYEVDCRREDYK